MSTILIVEDDPIVAMDVQAVLNQAGHTVIGTAPTFDRAVEIATARRPDIALVDYRLTSTRDGVIVARHLRRFGTTVIYVTGFADDVRLVDPRAKVIAKPYDQETLLRAVEHAIAAPDGG